MQKTLFTKNQVLQKLRHYCGYQEQSHHDAIQKLREPGVKKTMHGEIISLLMGEGYLNEERFALLYAAGKSRINQWVRERF